MTSLRKVMFLGAALALVGFMPARAEIVIAVAGPMSGSDIVTGESVRWGADMAVADLNASGGVLGQQVRLVIGDDACDGEQAVAVARKFVEERVVFVAGHACSGSSIPASDIYEAANIVMVSPTSTNPKLTELGRKNVFRVCGRDDEQGTIAANYMADNWAGKTFAIIYDDGAYGQGLAEATKKQLNQRGVTEVLYESYTAGQSDYSALVSRLIDAKVEVVYIGGYTQEAALIIRQAADREFHFQSVSGDGTFADDFSNIAGDAANGALVTFFPDPRKRTEVQPLLERFRAKGYEPDGNTLYAYAAVQSWAQAAEQAKTLEAGAVINTLKTNEFDTVLGRLRFNEKGDVNLPGFEWYIWKEGKPVPLE